jgi:hypothetical protein
VTRALSALALFLLVTVPAVHAPDSMAEDPVAELTRALKSLGPPGLLWGRLAVEEESPDGPTTPLVGVEVVLYPYVPSLMADLARIRESARDSGAAYDSAVARLQERLKAFEAQVVTLGPKPAQPTPGDPSRPAPKDASRAASGDASRPVPGNASRPAAKDGSPPAPGGTSGPGPGDASRPVTGDASRPSSGDASAPDTDQGLVRRRTTDSSGVFVVPDLPSGEWLLVVFHLTSYTQPKEARPRSPSKKRGGGGGEFGGGFLTRPATPAKEAEVWVTRVRVAPADRARALLTDRTRFMVGPLR